MVAGRDAFDDVADELYGLPLKEFTAARTAAAARAKEGGDPALAGRIGELKKPNTVGWLANQLVRRHPEGVRGLVDLGETLRDAMRRLAGDELRQSAGRQQQTVYALVQQAVQVAGAQSQGISADAKRGLEQTLHAALVDPQVAAELTAGRLTGPLSRTGLPDIPIGDLAPPSRKPDQGRPDQSRRPDQRRTDQDRRKADEDTAIAEAAAAAKAYAQAQHSAEQLEEAVRAAKEKVQRLTEQLDTAMNEQNRREAELRQARREVRSTEQAARRAAQRLPEGARLPE